MMGDSPGEASKLTTRPIRKCPIKKNANLKKGGNIVSIESTNIKTNIGNDYVDEQSHGERPLIKKKSNQNTDPVLENFPTNVTDLKIDDIKQENKVKHEDKKDKYNVDEITQSSKKPLAKHQAKKIVNVNNKVIQLNQLAKNKRNIPQPNLPTKSNADKTDVLNLDTQVNTPQVSGQCNEDNTNIKNKPNFDKDTSNKKIIGEIKNRKTLLEEVPNKKNSLINKKCVELVPSKTIPVEETIKDTGNSKSIDIQSGNMEKPIKKGLKIRKELKISPMDVVGNKISNLIINQNKNENPDIILERIPKEEELKQENEITPIRNGKYNKTGGVNKQKTIKQETALEKKNSKKKLCMSFFSKKSKTQLGVNKLITPDSEIQPSKTPTNCNAPESIPNKLQQEKAENKILLKKKVDPTEEYENLKKVIEWRDAREVESFEKKNASADRMQNRKRKPVLENKKEIMSRCLGFLNELHNQAKNPNFQQNSICINELVDNILHETDHLEKVVETESDRIIDINGDDNKRPSKNSSLEHHAKQSNFENNNVMSSVVEDIREVIGSLRLHNFNEYNFEREKDIVEKNSKNFINKETNNSKNGSYESRKKHSKLKHKKTSHSSYFKNFVNKKFSFEQNLDNFIKKKTFKTFRSFVSLNSFFVKKSTFSKSTNAEQSSKSFENVYSLEKVMLSTPSKHLIHKMFKSKQNYFPRKDYIFDKYFPCFSYSSSKLKMQENESQLMPGFKEYHLMNKQNQNWAPTMIDHSHNSKVKYMPLISIPSTDGFIDSIEKTQNITGPKNMEILVTDKKEPSLNCLLANGNKSETIQECLKLSLFFVSVMAEVKKKLNDLQSLEINDIEESVKNVINSISKSENKVFEGEEICRGVYNVININSETLIKNPNDIALLGEKKSINSFGNEISKISPTLTTFSGPTIALMEMSQNYHCNKNNELNKTTIENRLQNESNNKPFTETIISMANQIQSSKCDNKNIGLIENSLVVETQLKETANNQFGCKEVDSINASTKKNEYEKSSKKVESSDILKNSDSFDSLTSTHAVVENKEMLKSEQIYQDSTSNHKNYLKNKTHNEDIKSSGSKETIVSSETGKSESHGTDITIQSSHENCSKLGSCTSENDDTTIHKCYSVLLKDQSRKKIDKISYLLRNASRKFSTKSLKKKNANRGITIENISKELSKILGKSLEKNKQKSCSGNIFIGKECDMNVKSKECLKHRKQNYSSHSNKKKIEELFEINLSGDKINSPKFKKKGSIIQEKSFARKVVCPPVDGIGDHLQNIYNAVVSDDPYYPKTISSAKYISKYLKKANKGTKEVIFQYWAKICHSGHLDTKKSKPQNKSIWSLLKGTTNVIISKKQ